MKKKFKVDEIYREKFRGIETPPPADSWQNISAGLPVKREKKILPLWSKLAATAAVLAILVLLFADFLFNTTQPSTPPVTFEQKREIFNPDPTSADFEKFMKEAGATLEAIRTGSEISNGDQEKKTRVSTSDLANKPAGTDKVRNGSDKKLPTTTGDEGTSSVVASSSKERVNTDSAGNSRRNISSGIYLGSQPLVQGELELKTQEMVAEIPEKSFPEPMVKSEKSNENELAENSISEDRFSLTTSAGAVSLGKLGKGNLLARQFDGNNDKDKVTVSYGINLGYQLSEKIRIRSGFKKVDFSYSTQNLSYMAVLSSRAVSDPVSSSDGSLNSSVGGSLTQGFGLLEIPLELEYTLINKKIEINLIGGASSFFLQENNVSFDDGVNTADLGEGKNLNDLSFSANIGLGLNYQLTKGIQINLEPLFKYQINTFDSSLNLDSYYFGIYSGLRFRF